MEPSPNSNVRLLGGIDGSPVVNISAGLTKLAEQISHTVEWAHGLESCVEAGARVFFELGPGPALNEMAAALIPTSGLATPKTSERGKARVRASLARSNSSPDTSSGRASQSCLPASRQRGIEGSSFREARVLR
jgi:hypothetical protein